jgi:hypothetical protein
MDIVFILVGAFLALIGIVVSRFKLYNLIAGYNTMDEKEKTEYDIEGFAKLLRSVFLVTGISIITGSLLNIWLNYRHLSVIILLVTTISGVLYLLSRSQEFKSKQN